MTKEEFYVVTTVVTIFVAFCALGLTIWQGYQTRNHNRLSLRPALSSWSLYNPKRYTHKLMNKGHGTAIISQFNFLILGKEVSYSEFEHDVYEFSESYGKCDIAILAFTKENFMSSGESFNVIEIKYSESLPRDFFNELARRYALKIKYKCLYGKDFEFTQGW